MRTRYQCLHCSQTHHSEDAAYECCAGERITKRETGWECDVCKTEHPDRASAVVCCARVAKKHECPTCGELHATKQDATACCIKEQRSKQKRILSRLSGTMPCPECGEPINFRVPTYPHGEHGIYAVCENVKCPLHGQTQRPPTSVLDTPIRYQFTRKPTR